MAIKPIEILINAKDNASAVLDGLKAKVMAVGAIILSYFGIQAFGGMINGAADFEQALSRVQAATGATKEEMVLLRKAAEESGVDSIQAAGALENLAKAGLSAKDAIGALPPVINLAKAGDIELGQASEVVTAAVMGMGLQFSETARVVDVLVKGAYETKTSVKGMAEALSYAAPVANSMGLSLESVVAIIGQFAQAGIDASRAGTALNSILSQFNDPASKFRQELAAAGITTGNFETALHQLAKAGPAGAKAINAVGLEAGPALLAMLNRGMPALDALTAKLKEAEGAAAAAAKIMETNLNGSLSSLESGWKYVKDTLSTPVLPVITEAVNDLTASLRGAVQDGTVGKFGEALAAGFQGGVKWAKDFLAQINFTQVAADLRAFADRTGEVFTQIGEHATSAGNSAKIAYGVMSAGTNVVLGAVYKIGEAFAGVASNIQSGIALIMEGYAKVTPGKISEEFKQAAATMRLSAEATWASSEAMAAKSEAAFLKVAEGAQLARDGFAGLSTSATSAAPVLGATADKMSDVNAAIAAGDWDLVTKKIDDLTATTAKATPEVEALQKVLNAAIAVGDWDLVTKTLNEMGSVTKEAKASSESASAAVAKLREEYKALVANGDAQGAAEKIQEINKALQGTPPAAKEAAKAAEESAKATAAAFAGLGIASQASLKMAADSARTFYNQIKSDGTSTAADISSAFKVMAEKAIAANNGMVPSWVKAEAAAHGYEVQVDNAGKATLRAVNEGAKSVGGLGDQWRMSAEQVKANEEAMDRLMMRYQLSADYSERQIALLEKENALAERRNALERERLNIDKEGYSLNTAGQRVAVAVESQRSVYDRARSQGLTEAQALQLASETPMPYTGPGLRIPSSFDDGSNWGTNLQKKIDQIVLSNAASANPTAGSTYVTSVTLNGATRSIRTNDAESNSALLAMLRELSDARGTAS